MSLTTPTTTTAATTHPGRGGVAAQTDARQPTTAQLRECLPLVSVRDLRVAYGKNTPVLDGVSLELFPGEMVALLGASGSGKSTLMKSLTGFAPISGGAARVVGYDLTNLRRGQLRELRSGVGQIFQQFNLVGRLSVLTNVLTGALGSSGPLNLVGGFTREQRVRALDLLDRVGIAHKAQDPARSLSGGQQQRVAIARALMQNPKLILADEPVASLDPAMSHSVLELLREIAREDGIPVLVSLHVIPLALQHTDRIVGLRRGEILIADPSARLDAAALAPLYDGAPATEGAQ
ncbi:phosphonate ABC transporter ATP-binding protein [Leucobacter insecticola]|uniref:Phosphonate ABC transporter ATP-binding protein n=1 Tax=Leucobacter insecticola TaxID=2714934 RepID=A0A6G8FIJ0_9MICO|nr:phosphonate ABC transporter ATP-binding protein [Leucobacter insecticola]QIM16187.1 phosphonate ABC transporter ATP-binding protein [Leucobacter insecticola]